MPYTDDSHEFARQVKEIEERVQDLESKNRTQSVVNPLITVEDAYSYTDDVAVTVTSGVAGQWNTTNWSIARWNSP